MFKIMKCFLAPGNWNLEGIFLLPRRDVPGSAGRRGSCAVSNLQRLKLIQPRRLCRWSGRWARLGPAGGGLFALEVRSDGRVEGHLEAALGLPGLAPRVVAAHRSVPHQLNKTKNQFTVPANFLCQRDQDTRKNSLKELPLRALGSDIQCPIFLNVLYSPNNC